MDDDARAIGRLEGKVEMIISRLDTVLTNQERDRKELSAIHTKVAVLHAALKKSEVSMMSDWSNVEKAITRVVAGVLAILYADHTTGAHLHTAVGNLLK